MPLLQINTNATTDDEATIIVSASALVADMLGKPESYVMVILNAGASMSFAGTDAPCAHLKLKSLGLDEQATGEYSARLCTFMETSFGVDSGRVYIEFAGPERHLWGWDKRTF